MRIGFDAKRYFYNRTGLGNYSRVVVDSLAQTQPDCDFYLFAPGKPDWQAKWPNLHLHTLPNRVPWQRVWGVAKHAKQELIDVYHGLSNEIPAGLKRRNIIFFKNLLQCFASMQLSFALRRFHFVSVCQHKIRCV